VRAEHEKMTSWPRLDHRNWRKSDSEIGSAAHTDGSAVENDAPGGHAATNQTAW